MPSDYSLQIVHRASGKVVSWAPGMQAEVELIENLCQRVQAKGVGVGKTEAHVLDDIRAAFRELLHELKRLV